MNPGSARLIGLQEGLPTAAANLLNLPSDLG